jgi:hypothetical protein
MKRQKAGCILYPLVIGAITYHLLKPRRHRS